MTPSETPSLRKVTCCAKLSSGSLSEGKRFTFSVRNRVVVVILQCSNDKYMQ